ncbi:MAG: HVO_A0114 family putative DNA-binding protein [Betaproteobacteria bacterium]
MKRAIVRAGSEREFFRRGRDYARRSRAGRALPHSRLITFEDPVDMIRLLSPAKIELLRTVKAHPGSIHAIASRLGRDRSAVTREVAQMERLGLVQVVDETHPGHGRRKKVSLVAGEIRLQAVIA